MKINVLDRNGLFIETVEYKRTPLPIMFPGEHVVKINWDDNEPISPDDLRKPIRFMGKDYYPYFGAGSDAKQRMTWGMQRDLLEGTAEFVEDVTRFGRWAMVQGHFGQYSGNFTITSLPAGQKIAGAMVEDGCGYIRRSMAEKFLRKRKHIKFNNPRVGWMFWQRLDWDIMSGLLEPLIEDMCWKAADPKEIMYIAPKGFEYKSQLFENNKDMIEHPYVARSIARSSQDRYSRLAHSVHLKGEYKLVVPSNEMLCWPGHSGKIVVVRSPIDSNSSMQALEVMSNTREEQRVSNLQAMQVSISKEGFFSKGLLIIAEDNELPADVVVCDADVKMGPVPDGQMNAVITVTQAWEPGQCVGIGSDWNGKYVGDILGNDWDGDAVELHDCNDVYEPIWQAVSILPPASTPKIRKTKHKLSDGDLRPEMLSLVMYNLVGFATNMHARTFAVANREWLAYSLGFNTVEEMDDRFNRAIKLGTDIQKSYIDPEETIRFLNVTNANLNRMGVDAPWTKWDDQDWTRDGMPVVISRIEEGFEDTRYYYETVEDDIVTEHEANLIVARRSIFPYMDGTCAQIARVALPILAQSFEHTIPVRPLSAFRDYVEAPNKRDEEIAEKILQFWNARAPRVNFEDSQKIKELMFQLEDFVLSLEITDRMTVAKALWWLAHSARNVTENQAAAVFLTFPDECLEIVNGALNRPEIVYTMLTGVGQQLPSGLDGEYEVKAERILYKGVTRMVLCGSVSGQQAPADPELPANLLGFIAKNEPQPEPGEYQAMIAPFRGASWTAKLVAK